MADGFDVETSVLRDDAATWVQWEGRLGELAESIPLCGGQLSPTDFSGLTGAATVESAYDVVSRGLFDQVHVGCTQFTGISDKLTTIADLYDEAESLNVDAIKATMTTWGDN